VHPIALQWQVLAHRPRAGGAWEIIQLTNIHRPDRQELALDGENGWVAIEMVAI
jgi:hypothetical protein